MASTVETHLFDDDEPPFGNATGDGSRILEKKKIKVEKKRFATMNIPAWQLVELRFWKLAFEQTDRGRRWNFGDVLQEMAKAYAKKNPRVEETFKQLCREYGMDFSLAMEKKAKLRKSAMKSKNLGYLTLVSNGVKYTMKIHAGKKTWKERLPDYCHLPAHIQKNEKMPLLHPGKNISVKELLG